MIWEELCPTLSLNVESKMANLYKISEGGHILNLINNELDIPSPQIWRICHNKSGKIHCTQKMIFSIKDFFSKCDQMWSVNVSSGFGHNYWRNL